MSQAPRTPEKIRHPAQDGPLLKVRGLSVRFETESERVEAVRGVSFEAAAGETLALVGESGSGKTAAALAILGLLPPSARVEATEISLEGKSLAGLNEERLRRLRGNRVAMIFQEPMTALNPVQPIGRQLTEPLGIHQGVEGVEARRRALALMARTGIPDPENRLESYPHQLSGGQRQRVMIAMALACRPALLIADEPTTALDVTIQAQILALLKDLQREMGMGLLLITHDLPMVRQMADAVCVMRQGEVVESGPTSRIFDAPQHSYTRTLLDSLPADHPPPPARDPALLYEVREAHCHFPIKRGLLKRTVGHVKAVDGVDLILRRGETLGVVGESGSGKTTLAETLLRLNPGGGRLRFDGVDLTALSRSALRAWRRRMQVVFQDPFSSLSPRQTIGRILEEGMIIHGIEPDPARRRQRSLNLLDEVGLPALALERYPHQFSGGQRQRIAIARAMAPQPDLLVLDEPTSALDLSVQAQILALLRRLQEDHGLCYLFISHDLRVVRALSHHVAVMKDGRIVEQGATAALFAQPRHPYTQRLLSAALTLADPAADHPR